MQGQRGDVLVVQDNAAGVRAHDAAEHVEGGGLAGPVGPQDAHHLALGHAEAHVVHHEAAAVAFGKLPPFQDAHCFSSVPISPGAKKMASTRFFSPPSTSLR